MLLQKYLIMNPLQKYKAHSSQQFGRLRSNMFGENRLTDTCRAVFSKRAAPMSHDFFSCQVPRQAPTPDTRCGELRGGLSSRPPGAESLKQYKAAAAESACRQYRAVRWFLLPGAELRPRRQSADCKNAVTQSMADCKPAKTEAGQHVANLLKQTESVET